MRFDEPLGHARTLDGLWRAAAEQRLAHALEFVGRRGIGRFLAAERLTAGLLCARGIGSPCGACGPCKRLKIDSHPDVFVIDPTKDGLESIAIGFVTPRPDGPEHTIEQFLSLRPMEGGWRVVLVRESDRLMEPAQSALLKTLEEPGDTTLLVLETARPDRLLPTIHSRCVRVAFETPPLDEVERLLAARGLAPDEARVLARWSGGAPGEALALHARGATQMRAAIVRALEGGADPFELAGEIGDVDGEFPGLTDLARSRSRARACLDLAIGVLGDGLRAKSGLAPRELAHGDLYAGTLDVPDGWLGSALERVLEARQDVDHNLAPDVALERAFLALARPLNRTRVSR